MQPLHENEALQVWGRTFRKGVFCEQFDIVYSEDDFGLWIES
jgi:hypothetical protein